MQQISLFFSSHVEEIQSEAVQDWEGSSALAGHPSPICCSTILSILPHISKWLLSPYSCWRLQEIFVLYLTVRI